MVALHDHMVETACSCLNITMFRCNQMSPYNLYTKESTNTKAASALHVQILQTAISEHIQIKSQQQGELHTKINLFQKNSSKFSALGNIMDCWEREDHFGDQTSELHFK